MAKADLGAEGCVARPHAFPSAGMALVALATTTKVLDREWADSRKDVHPPRLGGTEDRRIKGKQQGHVHGGGVRIRADEAKIEAARKLVESGMSAAQAAHSVGVGRATLYRRGIGTMTARPE